MSVKHPIVAITGSSGAGTTTVMKSFQHIFRREKIKAQILEGDSMHRFNRMEMRAAMKKAQDEGNSSFSHFGPEANLLPELEQIFKQFSETGTGKVRKYIHDADEGKEFGQDPGTFTPWAEMEAGAELLFYEDRAVAVRHSFGNAVQSRFVLENLYSILRCLDDIVVS